MPIHRAPSRGDIHPKHTVSTGPVPRETRGGDTKPSITLSPGKMGLGKAHKPSNTFMVAAKNHGTRPTMGMAPENGIRGKASVDKNTGSSNRVPMHNGIIAVTKQAGFESGMQKAAEYEQQELFTQALAEQGIDPEVYMALANLEANGINVEMPAEFTEKVAAAEETTEQRSRRHEMAGRRGIKGAKGGALFGAALGALSGVGNTGMTAAGTLGGAIGGASLGHHVGGISGNWSGNRMSRKERNK